MAKISAVEGEAPKAKPKSILRKTLTGAMKAPPTIGATTASKKTTVRITNKAKKAALAKVKEAALPISMAKRTAARVADVFEEPRIPKKQKVAEVDEETEEEEEADE